MLQIHTFVILTYVLNQCNNQIWFQPMETETVQERTTFETSALPEEREEIPETFPGHEALPSVNIIYQYTYPRGTVYRYKRHDIKNCSF